MLTGELQRRLRQAGSRIQAYAVSPGLVATSIFDSAAGPLKGLVQPVMRCIAKTPAQVGPELGFEGAAQQSWLQDVTADACREPRRPCTLPQLLTFPLAAYTCMTASLSSHRLQLATLNKLSSSGEPAVRRSSCLPKALAAQKRAQSEVSIGTNNINCMA